MTRAEQILVSNDQLTLPLEVRPAETVRWYNVELQTKRRLLIGRKVVVNLVKEEGKMISTTDINVDDIDKVVDPDLRYALRLKAAAEAAGSFQHSLGSNSSHDVQVDATHEGFNSRFVHANYTGVTKHGKDMFMENLRRFAPDYEGNYE